MIDRISYFIHKEVGEINPVERVAKQWFVYHKVKNVLDIATAEITPEAYEFTSRMLLLASHGVHSECKSLYEYGEVTVDATYDVSLSQEVDLKDITLDDVEPNELDMEGLSPSYDDDDNRMDQIKDELENYGLDLNIDSSNYEVNWDNYNYAVRPKDDILVNFLYQDNQDYYNDAVEGWMTTVITNILDENRNVDYMKFWLSDMLVRQNKIESDRITEQKVNEGAE